jgi:hypothetical protein
VHQPDIGPITGRTPVKIDALQERAEAVPHPDDGNSDFIHCRKTLKVAVAARLGQESCHNIAIFEERNAGATDGENKRKWSNRGLSQRLTAGDFD